MFDSRVQAGELLALRLRQKGYGGKSTVVLAIPRGGVVTGRVVADILRTQLDIVITRKIPSPDQQELAIGAVGPEGIKIIDVDLFEKTETTDDYLARKVEELKREMKEREKKFRGGKLPIDISGKILILVDDGIATGATVEAAIRFLRTEKSRKLILATPVASRESIEKMEGLVDELVVLESPEDFRAVGQFYREFPQVTDEEVKKLLI